MLVAIASKQQWYLRGFKERASRPFLFRRKRDVVSPMNFFEFDPLKDMKVGTITEEESMLGKQNKLLAEMQEDMRQQHSKEETEKAKDRSFQIKKSFLDAFLGAIAALSVEHFHDIISLIQKALK